jgi:hypothetical protein
LSKQGEGMNREYQQQEGSKPAGHA